MNLLVIGGYGNFGKRLVSSLLLHTDHEITLAGRSPERCEGFKRTCGDRFGKSPATLPLDVFDTDLAQKLKSRPIDLVVNASGPFQADRGAYRVARACAAIGAHYVDLADDRRFVCDFADTLDPAASAADLVMITGASSVPGLSSAVIDDYRAQFLRIDSMTYGISPGNRSERGRATVGSILSYVGHPFTTPLDGAPAIVLGWRDLRYYDFGPPIGRRWFGNCNIPDLELLPRFYPQLKSLRFQAGLELGVLHLGLWLLSFLPHIGLIENLERWSGALTRISEHFIGLGSDVGGMFVELKGLDQNGQPRTINWQLIAENGSGPNVPTIAAELAIEKIAAGKLEPGARPCVGLFNLDEFFSVAERWGIYQREVIHD